MKRFKKLAALALAALLALALLAGCSGSGSGSAEYRIMESINTQRKLYGRETIQNDPALKRLGEEILDTLENNGTKIYPKQYSYASPAVVAAFGDNPMYLLQRERFEQLQPSLKNRMDWSLGFELNIENVLNASTGDIFLIGKGVELTYFDPDYDPQNPSWALPEHQVISMAYPFECNVWESEIAKGMSAWSVLDKVGVATKEVGGTLRYIILAEKTS